MKRTIRPAILAVICAASASAAVVYGQGGEWTTSGFDAQRTAWVATDAALTKEAVQKGQFKFLWKAQFENEPRQMNSLTAPVLLDRLIGYRGFKTLAFVGGSADRVFAIDTDLARPYWTTHLNYSAATGGQPSSSVTCPGGLTAAPTRRTVLAPSAFARGGGGGRGGRSGSAVGEPGRGAAILSQAPQARGGPAAGRGAAPAARGRAVAPVPFGGVDPLYAVGSDGFLHTLRVSNGADAAPAVAFLPPNTKSSALIFVDGMVYTTTTDECGAEPNAVWAIDVTTPESKVVSWRTGGADVAGATGVAFGTDGTLYVALGAAPLSTLFRGSSRAAAAGVRADAVVALDRETLQPKDWFSAPGIDFNTSPTVIRYKDKDLITAAGNDGRLYLLDSAALGGADHATPLYATPKYSAPGAGAALATWDDRGTRWILAPVAGAPPAGVKFASNGLAPTGSVAAFKLVDQAGKLTLEPAWSSRDLKSPLAPVVVNGLVLVASSGEYRGGSAPMSGAARALRSTPAVLYVLDGTTGQELWSSGRTITSFARGGLAAGGGQAYVVTYDSHMYAFGIPVEH